MSKIYQFLADGFEPVEALAPVDVMRRAGINVVTVSIMGRTTVEAAHGIKVVADALFDEVDFSDADALVLPGGSLGTENLSAFEPLRVLIASANAVVVPHVTPVAKVNLWAQNIQRRRWSRMII